MGKGHFSSLAVTVQRPEPENQFEAIESARMIVSSRAEPVETMADGTPESW